MHSIPSWGCIVAYAKLAITAAAVVTEPGVVEVAQNRNLRLKYPPSPSALTGDRDEIAAWVNIHFQKWNTDHASSVMRLSAWLGVWS